MTAPAYTRDEAALLAARLRHLKAKGQLSFTQLLRDCVVESNEPRDLRTAQQKLSRWLRRSNDPELWNSLDNSTFLKIQEALTQKGLLDPSELTISGTIYQQLANWIGMGSPQSFEDLKEHVCGIYAIYRPSFLFRDQGKFLKGKLTIEFNRGNAAIETVEEYRIPNADEPTAQTHFVFRGFAFRRNNKYRIHAKQVGLDEFQYTYFEDALERGGTERARDIRLMHGIVHDVEVHIPYSARVVAKRKSVDKENEPDELAFQVLDGFLRLPDAVKQYFFDPNDEKNVEQGRRNIGTLKY